MASEWLREAERLIEQIAGADSPYEQRMLLAAAINLVMQGRAVVVGGTAEQHWAGEEYRSTDLDIVPILSLEDEQRMQQIGFRREGRHWVRDDVPEGVEFPDCGDPVNRIDSISVSGQLVNILGLEDLYLNRLRQATMSWPERDFNFDAAFEVALTNYEDVDWEYIEQQIAQVTRQVPIVGERMRDLQGSLAPRVREAFIRQRSLELGGDAGACLPR